jgi:phosphatidylserine/phosphatidylglycerophosphate/cardiolipin synthase-like enzyme
MDRILRVVDPRCADRLRLYTYAPGIFQHRKLVTVDGDFAWVSSSNFSDRSLLQGGDTELGVFVRDEGVARAIRENSLELIRRYGVEVRRRRTHRAINGWLVRRLQRLMDTRLL